MRCVSALSVATVSSRPLFRKVVGGFEGHSTIVRFKRKDQAPFVFVGWRRFSGDDFVFCAFVIRCLACELHFASFRELSDDSSGASSFNVPVSLLKKYGNTLSW